MKKVTWFALLLTIAAALVATEARAQGTLDPNLNNSAKEKEVDRELNNGLDKGKSALDYTVDCASLFDNDHRVFWKQGDSVRIHITNNPFRYKCTPSVNESAIADDDLSILTKALGVNQSSSNNTNNNPDNTGSDQRKATPAEKTLATKETSTFQADLATVESEEAAAKNGSAEQANLQTMQNALSEIVIAGENNNVVGMKTTEKNLKSQVNLQSVAKANPRVRPVVNHLDQLEAKAPVVPPPDTDGWKKQIADLGAQADKIATNIRLLKSEYDHYASGIPDLLKGLVDPKASAQSVEDQARALDRNAKAELRCLTDGVLDETHNVIAKCPPDAARSIATTLEERLLQFAQAGAKLHSAIEPYLISTDQKVAADITSISDNLHDAGEKVVAAACTDEGMRQTDLSSITTGLITPLDAVLNDPTAFGYVYPTDSYRREGPWVDPELVTMTLERTKVSPFANTSADGSTPVNSSSSFNCSSDTTDMFTHGDTYTSLADFFTDKPVKGQPNTYTKNQNQPVHTSKKTGQIGGDTTGDASGSNAAKNSKSGTTAKNTPAADSTVLVQPWEFGRVRLVLSGGITTSFLADKQYQRSTNSSGTAVVGLKTDQKQRITPMLYGHVLLGYGRHDPDAWYGTLGVTAKSDNQSTDPEFLVGVSRSFAQHRFFFTVGAYLGEKQKLDGGLQLGQAIPSSLTAELPVTKGYHVGAGFGISYRFASSKDPTKNTATTTTQKKAAK